MTGKRTYKAKFVSNSEVARELANRLDWEYDLDSGPDIWVNSYFVAPFGEDEHALHFYDIVSPGRFFREFEATGVKLNNGFFEVALKQPSPYPEPEGKP